MRTLLFALVAGSLALIAAPQNVLACHKGIPHGAETSCDTAPPPSEPPTFVLKDCADLACGAEPKQVGDVVTVDLFANVALTRVQFLDSFGTIRNVPLRVDSGRILSTNYVFYDEPNCNGNTWIWPSDPKPLGPAFDIVAVISDIPGFRSLWIPTSDRFVEITSASTASANGCAPNDISTQDVLPAEKVVDDLHLEFPPPYSLEVQ